MKKMFRVTMTKGNDILLEGEKIDKLITSPDQMIAIKDDDGEIRTLINKAHIVSIIYDRAETRIANETYSEPQLPGPEDQISMERIALLKEKAHRLTKNIN